MVYMARESRRLLNVISSYNINNGFRYEIDANEALTMDELVLKLRAEHIEKAIDKCIAKGNIVRARDLFTYGDMMKLTNCGAVNPIFDKLIFKNPDPEKGDYATNIMMYQIICDKVLNDDMTYNTLHKMFEITTKKYSYRMVMKAVDRCLADGQRNFAYMYEVIKSTQIGIELDAQKVKQRLISETYNEKFYKNNESSGHDQQTLDTSKSRFNELIGNARLKRDIRNIKGR